MAGYGPAGADNAVSLNSQKQHVALYVGQAAIENLAGRRGSAGGESCVRYRRPEQVDLAVVADMLEDVRAREEPICRGGTDPSSSPGFCPP